MVNRVSGSEVQIDRIVNSELFRNSQVLKRLLVFLAEKSLAGEADQLKEYTIGIDAIGKPESYDPREDSVVRIQVGRLRQKLAEYYRTEGKVDEVVVELPKGRFGLVFQTRPESTPEIETNGNNHSNGNTPLPVETAGTNWKNVSLALGVVLLLALAYSIFTAMELAKERARLETLRTEWSPDLETLWRPFLTSTRSLLIATPTPMFIGFAGAGLFRDLEVSGWEEAEASPRIAAIRKALGNPPMYPRYGYSGTGHVGAVFVLGKLLSGTKLNVSLARSSQLSWQQFTENNVLVVGPPRLYQEHWKGFGVILEFIIEEGGVRVVHPRQGEPEKFPETYPSMRALDTAGAVDSGVVYGLITHTPGPMGTGNIQSFSSNHSPGSLGAVQWYTNPALAKTLVSKIKLPSGKIPEYYQVLVKVHYKDGVPTESTYVAHRELHVEKKPAGE